MTYRFILVMLTILNQKSQKSVVFGGCCGLNQECIVFCGFLGSGSS
jgi:hypothetical protein